jgi:CelD/BcsL family acetyltransferase involved in cellulose biosynthesis
VDEISNFEDLEDDWGHLLEKNVLGNNVFLTWEWLSTWWKHFGNDRKLLLLRVEDDNQVLAIAPLMLSKYKLPGFGSFKKIEFLGAGHSDYHNFIVLERENECLTAMMNYLDRNIVDWDWIELKEVPEPTATAGCIDRLSLDSSFKLGIRKRVCEICPYVSLPDSFSILMKRLGKNARQNLNKYMRRIEEKHKVELRRYDEARLSVEEAMELFIKLHEKRWASEGLPGAFRSKEDNFRNFHMKVAECFARKGWLGLYFLTANDEPVSVQYTFEYGKKMYYYLAGFDPAYSQYSVGNLMVRCLLERCITNGFQEYDMMRGDEAYKIQWTSTFRRNLEIRLVREGRFTGFCNWVTWNKTVTDLAARLKLSLNKTRAK